MGPRASQWLLLLLAAALGGLTALVLERAVSGLALAPRASPTPPLPTAEVPVVTLPTAVSVAAPSGPSGESGAEVAALGSALAQHGGLLLVSRAERHTALAAAALLANDVAIADRELVAARAALDGAFALVPEDLKQVIDGQRREVGRMRSELQLDPEGMDERLRATQDLLLGLIVPPTQ